MAFLVIWPTALKRNIVSLNILKKTQLYGAEKHATTCLYARQKKHKPVENCIVYPLQETTLAEKIN